MKTIFTISALAFSMVLFAQEAGKKGELLKNEAPKNEMQTQKREAVGSRTNPTSKARTNSNSGIIDNSNYRTQNRNNQSTVKSEKKYQWHYNYGYSEVFLRIPERGYFTVEVGDQMMSNASGKFRFFDLSSGRIPVSIYENGYLVYRSQINIKNNSRMVLDFFTDHGLFLLETVPVQSYGFNEWDDIWNNPYGNSGNYGYYGNVMDSRTFSLFVNAVEDISFDKERLNFINTQAKTANFTSAQIKAVLDEFSFDEQRLAAAKILYNKCVDRNNYFMVYETFSFDRYKNDLMKYIANV